MSGNWAECEREQCRRFFWSAAGAKFCSQSCARHVDHLRRKPERQELVELINEFLQQPEVAGNRQLERVAWRVFGK